jgi:hypothetical protein
MAALTKEYAPAIDALKADLAKIEEKVILGTSLADAMRLGSKSSTQIHGWGSGTQACALSAAGIGAAALGYIK